MIDLIDGNTGEVVVRVPDDAIDACSHPGPCDGDVATYLADPETEWIQCESFEREQRTQG